MRDVLGQVNVVGALLESYNWYTDCSETQRKSQLYTQLHSSSDESTVKFIGESVMSLVINLLLSRIISAVFSLYS